MLAWPLPLLSPSLMPMVQITPKAAANTDLHQFDPLACAIAPSPDETPEQRIARLKAEERAKKLSDEIDKFLKKTANSDFVDGHRRKATAIRILLLGQSESGKSTALKNFQLLYNPQSFQTERAAWRLVILFNLVQSIRVLHTIITDAMQTQQLEEAADSFRKSPASPIFGRPPPGDFQDLFPPPPSQAHLHRKQSSGPAELTNGRAPETNQDGSEDAASTHSTNTSGSSSKHAGGQQPMRRSSFFGSSKEGKSKDKEGKKARARPATASAAAPSPPTSITTPTTATNAFCLPAQPFGSSSSRHGSNPTQSAAAAIMAASPTQTHPQGQVQTHATRKTGIDGTVPSPSPSSARPSTSPLSLSTSSSTLNASIRRQQLPSPSRTLSSAVASSAIDEASPSFTSLSTAYQGSSAAANTSHADFTAQHQLLLMRLKPLLTVELALLRRLSLPDEPEPDCGQDYPDETASTTSAPVVGVTQRENEAGGFEAPARMSASAVRGGPIMSEREAVKLDFNVGGMHAAAVSAAKEGMIDFSAPSLTSLTSFASSKGGSNGLNKSTSAPGRPRAHSVADVGNGAVSDSGMDRKVIVPSYTPAPSFPPAMSNGGNIGWTPGFTLQPSASTSSLDHPGPHNAMRAKTSRAEVPVPELFVRSTTNWKEKLKKWKKYDPGVTIGNGKGGDKQSIKSSEWNPWDEDDDPAHFIQACAEDLKTLWSDPIVRNYLARNRYKLEHLPGFFLSDVDRIVSRDYTPTDDDILRARLKTIGAVEHRFSVNTKATMSRDWLVYDVGGARSQRAVWVPYFDAVDAIIFIVSLSSFDQTLSEDPTVNRMEDSLRLFRDVVSSPILKNVNIILFLNKYDLLESKLNSGVQLSRYFKRYGDRPNNAEAVTKYFRAKFSAIYEKFTPTSARRAFNIHATSLTNPQATKGILEAVNESILQMHITRTVS